MDNSALVKYYDPRTGKYEFATVLDVGDLSKLNTTIKTDLVSAINSLEGNGWGGGGEVPPELIDELENIKDAIASIKDGTFIIEEWGSFDQYFQSGIADAIEQLNIFNREQIVITVEEIEAAIQESKDYYDQHLAETMQDVESARTDMANAQQTLNETAQRLEEADLNYSEVTLKVDEIDQYIEGNIKSVKFDIVNAVVTEYESLVRQMEDEFGVNVEESFLSYLTGRVGKAEADISVQSGKIESKVGYDEFQYMPVEDIDQYNKNLLFHTMDLSESWERNDVRAYITTDSFRHTRIVAMDISNAYYSSITDTLELGKTYTLSASFNIQPITKAPNEDRFAPTDGNYEVSAFIDGIEYPMVDLVENLTGINGFKRLSVGFVSENENPKVYFRIKNLNAETSTGYMTAPKLEAGNKSTPWQPHFDDEYATMLSTNSLVRQQGDEIVSLISSNKELGDKFVTATSSFQQLEDGFIRNAELIEEYEDAVVRYGMEVEELNDRITQKVWMDDFSDAVESISIDGKNRVLNSDFSNVNIDNGVLTIESWENVDPLFTIETVEGIKYASIKRTGLTGNLVASMSSNKFAVKNGERLMFGFDAIVETMPDVANVFQIELLDINDIRVGIETFTLAQLDGEIVLGEPSRLNHQVVINREDVAKARVRLMLTRNGHIKFTRVMAQQGTIKDTQWSPAPEDAQIIRMKMQTEINQTAQAVEILASDERMDALEGILYKKDGKFQVSPTEILARVTSSELGEDAVVTGSQLKLTEDALRFDLVGKDGLIQSINASEESLKIDFDRVEVNGLLLAQIISTQYLDVSEGFKIMHGSNMVLGIHPQTGELTLNVPKLTINARPVATQEDLENIELTPGPKGEDGIDGKDGVGLIGTNVNYATSTSGTVRPNNWGNEVPTTQPGDYLWTRTTWDYSDNTSKNGYTVSRIGKDGNTGENGVAGKDGVGISNTLVEYTPSTSGSIRPTSGWSTTIPTVSPGDYLWTKITWTYTDSTKESGYSVAKMGEKGDTGEQGPQGLPARLARLNNLTYAVPFDSNGNNPSVSSILFSAHVQGFTNPYYEFVVDGSVARAANTEPKWTMDTSSTKYSDFPKSVVLNVRDGSANGPIIASDTSTVIGVRPGVDGKDAYTVVMGNESHTFVGDVSNALAGNTTVSVIAYKGGTRVSATIGSITGLPDGMSSAIYSNGTTSARVTFTVTTAMKTTSGSINIPITVDGKAFTKVFNYAIALKGVKGDKGTDGIAGKDGVGIKTTVLAYASSTSGTTTPTSGWSTTVPTVAPGNYLWTRTTWTYTDNSVENGYTVSRIGKDGNTGKDGVAGKDGVGISKTVIHYAPSTNGTTAPASGWVTTIPSVVQGSYLWTRTTWTYTDKTSETGYSAARMGADGAKGNTGKDGNPGKDGVGIKSTTITYGVSANETTQPATYTGAVPTLVKGQYLWTKTVWVYTDSTTETGYTKTYIPKDGNNGTNGIAGKDGVGISKTTITYAKSSSGTTAPTTGYTTTVPSANPGEFVWTKTVWTYTDNTTEVGYSVGRIGTNGTSGKDGAPGKDGVGITDTIVEYGSSTSGTTKPTTWTTAVPTVAPGNYQWTRTTWIYTDGTSEIGYTNGRIGKDGNNGTNGIAGKDGVGIKSTVIHYGSSTSGTSHSGVAWATAVPSVPNGQFLWTRTTWSYDDNTTETGYSVAKMGETGARGATGPQGVSITKVDVQYYLSTSNTSLTGGSWSTTAPAWKDGRFMWSKTVTTYTSGSPTESKPVCITGAKGSTGGTGSTGATGRGVSTIVEQFYLSNSKTAQTGGSWSTTMPTWSSGKYVWTRSLITYTTGTPATSTTEPLVSSEWEAINELEVGGRNLLLNTNREHGATSAREYMSLPYDLTPIFEEHGLNQEYTMSFDLKSKNISNFDSINIYPNPGTIEPNRYRFPSRGFKVTTEYQRFSMTFKPTDGNKEKTTTYISVYGQYDTGNFPMLRNIKLEKGNKATDWTPAPEDVEAAYTAVAQAKAEAERVKAEAYADGKVSTEEKARIADANAKLAAAKKHAEDQINISEGKATSWKKRYVVNSASPLKLTKLNGDALSPFSSYEVSAKVLSTGTVTSATSLFKAKESSGQSSNGWELVTIYTRGTSSNHPEFFIDSDGDPAVRLYSHSTKYTVEVTHTEYIGSQSSYTLSENIARAEAELVRIKAEAYADGKVTDEEKARIADANAKLAAAKKYAEDQILADKTIKDTRNDNQNPSWYFTNYPKQIVREFKNISTMGLSVPGQSYGILTTDVPWTGNSGGAVKQEFKVHTQVFKRSGTSTSWTSWVNYDEIAETAKSDAATAKGIADGAATSASTANSLLSDIASDSKLTPTEKKAAKKEWDIIVGEKPKIDRSADTYGITTQKTTYNTAFNALSNYLSGLLANLNTTSNIVGSTFRANFRGYYNARQDLLNAIADGAKSLVDEIEIGGRNLVVLRDISDNTYLSTNGTTASATGHATTAYIEVLPNQDYVWSASNINQLRIADYNSSKTYIRTDFRGGDQGSVVRFKTSSTAAFIRVSAQSPSLSTWKIEKGSHPTDWTPSPEDVYQYVDDVEIGGTQLLDGTSNEYRYLNLGEWYTAIAGGGTKTFADYGLSIGDTITYRVYIKSTSGNGGVARLTVFEANGSYTTRIGSAIENGAEGYSTVTYTIESDRTRLNVGIQNSVNTGVSASAINYKEPKLEKGVKATAWSMSQNDYQMIVDSVEVGGDNLLRIGEWDSYPSYNTIPVVSHNGRRITFTKNNHNSLAISNTRLPYGPNVFYVISGYARIDDQPVTNDTWGSYRSASTYQGSTTYFNVRDSDGYFVIVQNWTSNSRWLFHASNLMPSLNGTITIDDFMVQAGNKPSGWKLNPEDERIGGENLLYNSDFSKTAGGAAFTVGGIRYSTYPARWGGYNGGVNNATTNYHMHLDDNTFGYNVVEFNESNGTRHWKGGNISLDGLVKSPGFYTVSVDLYATGSETRLFGGFYYYKKGGTTMSFHGGQYSISPNVINNWKRYSALHKLPDDVDLNQSIRFYMYGYGFGTNSILYVRKIQLQEGTKASSWSMSREDMEEVINLKADSSATESALNEAAAKLQVLQQEVEAAATANELSGFIDKYNKDMQARDKAAIESEGSLSSALTSITAIQNNLSDMSETWTFIDRFIKNTPQGIVVGNDSSGSYILIKEDRLSFYSNGQEVAFISQNLMEISRGAFVEQIQIAKYQFEESTTNHLTIRYVG